MSNQVKSKKVSEMKSGKKNPKQEVVKMKRLNVFSMFVLGVVMFLFVSVKPSFAACPVNMAQVGPTCVDKYEASVWSLPPDVNGNPRGTQYGVDGDDYPCSDPGNNCSKNKPGKIFAVSAPDELPSRYITWFQAEQACANVGKRLLTNQEWQRAAAGTREQNLTGTRLCNAYTFAPSLTGSYPGCVSNWGVLDMVGNLWEWVADWVPASQGCGSPLFNDIADRHCQHINGHGTAALIRGGDFREQHAAGVFALSAINSPSTSHDSVGFRCAK